MTGARREMVVTLVMAFMFIIENSVLMWLRGVVGEHEQEAHGVHAGISRAPNQPEKSGNNPISGICQKWPE